MKLCNIINRALQICEKNSSDVDTDKKFAIILHGMGRCLSNLHKPDDALFHFENSLKIFEKMIFDIGIMFDLRNVENLSLDCFV